MKNQYFLYSSLNYKNQPQIPQHKHFLTTFTTTQYLQDAMRCHQKSCRMHESALWMRGVVRYAIHDRPVMTAHYWGAAHTSGGTVGCGGGLAVLYATAGGDLLPEGVHFGRAHTYREGSNEMTLKIKQTSDVIFCPLPYYRLGPKDVYESWECIYYIPMYSLNPSVSDTKIETIHKIQKHVC